MKWTIYVFTSKWNRKFTIFVFLSLDSPLLCPRRLRAWHTHTCAVFGKTNFSRPRPKHTHWNWRFSPFSNIRISPVEIEHFPCESVEDRSPLTHKRRDARVLVSEGEKRNRSNGKVRDACMRCDAQAKRCHFGCVCHSNSADWTSQHNAPARLDFFRSHFFRHQINEDDIVANNKRLNSKMTTIYAVEKNKNEANNVVVERQPFIVAEWKLCHSKATTDWHCAFALPHWQKKKSIEKKVRNNLF